MSSIILEVSRGGLASSPGKAHRYEDYRIVPALYPLRIAGTVFAVIVIALVLFSVFSNEKWGWPVFAEWFFSEPVLAGLGRTLLLTALATVSGCTLGTLLALARVSSPLLAALSWCYIWLLRSAPLIVLLLILNNLGYLYESIKIANPLNGDIWVDYPMVMLLTPFTAALIGLTLNQSAFFAEVVRGGILSVDQGQHEAAAALGLKGAAELFAGDGFHIPDQPPYQPPFRSRRPPARRRFDLGHIAGCPLEQILFHAEKRERDGQHGHDRNRDPAGGFFSQGLQHGTGQYRKTDSPSVYLTL